PALYALSLHDALPISLGRVVVRGFLDPIALAYRSADLVVSRAGAMTVAELCAWGKPSVLVPLPSAAADHQTSNARALGFPQAHRDRKSTRLNSSHGSI